MKSVKDEGIFCKIKTPILNTIKFFYKKNHGWYKAFMYHFQNNVRSMRKKTNSRIREFLVICDEQKLCDHSIKMIRHQPYSMRNFMY